MTLASRSFARESPEISPEVTDQRWWREGAKGSFPFVLIYTGEGRGITLLTILEWIHVRFYFENFLKIVYLIFASVDFSCKKPWHVSIFPRHGLKMLNFNKNGMNGSLPTFTGFLELEVLDLTYNLLSESIESQLNGLSGLKSWNRSFNMFTGSIPIGKSMPSLEHLMLKMNNFQDTIPKKITHYQNLSWIDFTMKKLLGSLPMEIGDLSLVGVLQKFVAVELGQELSHRYFASTIGSFKHGMCQFENPGET
ncbi:receptor-like protein 52 [Tripterygium wilfordii]|uniref:receptor-like protein 52 n=1 Tax=Tripterygium wilfordii TaxID=458696 RepID=UPI0018F82196|nr:receptor-like protein 52 [Tripterygium wilfordii]